MFKFRIGAKELKWKMAKQKTKILTIDLTIENPWLITADDTLDAEICDPSILRKLQGNCLKLRTTLPFQTYPIEQTLTTTITRSLFSLTLLLTLPKRPFYPPPSYFADLLLIAHMVATGTILPGSMAEFNRFMVRATTLTFNG